MTDPGKGTPANIDAERAVLGALLIDPASIRRIADDLEPTDFWRETHQWIYGAMLRLYQRQAGIDLLTVADFLEDQGLLDQIGGPTYLTELSNDTPTSVHLAHYAGIVKADSKRRKLLDLSTRIGIRALDTKTQIDDVMSGVESDFHKSTAHMAGEKVVTGKDLMGTLYDETEETARRKGVTGIPTGLKDVDAILGGLHKSDFSILAARPAVGKTATMLNVALTGAKADFSILVVSLEMSALQVAQRLACIECGLTVHNLRQGKLHDDDWPRLMDAMERISQLPIYVVYSGAFKPSQVRAIANRVQAEHGLDLLCIDYLQLMTADDNARNRQEAVSSISRELKLIARQLDIPILANAQLSRGVEARVDKRPVLSDLRESGALEQDADTVNFLYRHEMYEPEQVETRAQMEWIVAKHRNGPTGTALLAFRAWCGQVVTTKVEHRDGIQIRMPLDGMGIEE